MFSFIKSLFARKAKRRVREVIQRLEEHRLHSGKFKGWVEEALSRISAAYNNKRRALNIKGRFRYLAANNQVRDAAANLIQIQLTNLGHINKMLQEFLEEVNSIYDTLQVPNKLLGKMIEHIVQTQGCISEYKKQLENQLAALNGKDLGKGDNKLWDESEKIKKLKEIFGILEISGNELQSAARIIRTAKQVFDTYAPLIQEKIKRIEKTAAPHYLFTNGLAPLKREEIRGRLTQSSKLGDDPVSRWKREFGEWLKFFTKEVEELNSLFRYQLNHELTSKHIHYSDFERYYGEEIKPLEETIKQLNALLEGSRQLEMNIYRFDPYAN